MFGELTPMENIGFEPDDFISLRPVPFFNPETDIGLPKTEDLLIQDFVDESRKLQKNYLFQIAANIVANHLNVLDQDCSNKK